MVIFKIITYTRSLGALRAPTSSWRPFGPLDFVLCTLRQVIVPKKIFIKFTMITIIVITTIIIIIGPFFMSYAQNVVLTS